MVDINVRAVVNLLLEQYNDATRLKALLNGLTGVIQTRLVDPLLVLERALNPDVSEGILLDWIGTRLSLPRPFVAATDAEFFGFDGTSAVGGRTFGQAPFFTTRRGIELVEPVGDVTYRLLLKARARRLRGGANRETIEAVLAILWPRGNGYVDETTDPMSLRVEAEANVVWALVTGSLQEKLIPRPAGFPLNFVRLEPVFRRITDAGDQRITEGGDPRRLER